MNKAVTFSSLHSLLDGLGFTKTIVEGSHVYYEHKPSGTLILLPLHRTGERVRPTTLVAVRGALDANGFLERDEFEDALRQAAANGRARTRRK